MSEGLPARVAELKGQVDRNLGKDNRKAERAARAALAAARRSGDKRSLGLAHLTLARVDLAMGRPADALRLLRPARAELKAAGDPALEARVLLAEMTAHALRGRHAKAIAVGREARRRFARLGDRVLVAQVDVNIGNCYHRQDLPMRAIPPYQRAKRFFDDHGMAFESAAVAHNLANIVTLLDDYAESGRLYLEARDGLLAAGQQTQAAQAEYNLAWLRFLEGRYRESLDGFAAAEVTFTRLGDPVHVALCHLDRAEVLLQLGLLREAEREAAAARADFHRLRMPYEEAKARTFHALAHSGRGFRLGVGEELARAREVFRRIGNRTWMAVLDLHLARLALAEGASDKASELAGRAARAFVAARAPMKQAAALEVWARAEMAHGRTRTAERLLRSSAQVARRCGAAWVESRARVGLAASLARSGRQVSALREIDRALDRLEALHAAAPPSTWEEALAGDRESTYREAVSLCLALGEDGDQEAIGRAFLYAERARARSLAMRRLESPEGEATGTAEHRELDRLTRIRHDLWWRRNALERAGREGAWRAERGLRLTREVSRLEREARQCLERLGKRGTMPAALAEVVVPSPEAIAQALPPNTALLEYVLGPEGTALFIIDGEGIRVRRLSARHDQVLGALRALQFQMNKFGLGAEYVGRHRELLRASAERALFDLGRLLLDGVEEEVAARRLIVAPHDILHYVPFQALRTERGWLIDQREVSTVPSASLLRLCLTAKPGGGGALVVGVPDAGTPAVRREVDEVAQALGGARTLIGEEATLAAFRREAPACRVVHVSTHGIFRPDSPMASAVRLADGWLTFAEVSSLSLQARLVVLSACHAGLDRIFSGDEQMGLGRAILTSGAASLVTTLWAVEDEGMALWMGDFYRALARGAGPAAALREACLFARERDPHPHSWAPCVLAGKPNGTVLEQ